MDSSPATAVGAATAAADRPAGGTAVSTARSPRRRSSRAVPRRPFRHSAWAYLFVLPATIALLFAFGYPLFQVVETSFYSGSLGNLTYVGTQNYTGLFQDPVFVQSILNNLKLLATVPVMTALALAIALVLNTQVRGWRKYRSITFLPYILPATAIGLTFGYLLEQSGILNTFLRQWHLDALAQDWLGSSSFVVPTIGTVIIWQQLGFGVVVFSAALLGVPQETVEAARMDGANGWQIQWSILVPQIKRVIEFFIVLEAIAVLSSIFTYVFVLTKGGPGNTSSVMEYYIFQNGFENGAIGVASAAAVVLLFLAGILIFFYLRLRARSEEGAR
jgi:ABC-type sugar transport system permease subunit